MKNIIIVIKAFTAIFLLISCKSNDVITDNVIKFECLLKSYVINYDDSTRIELQLNHNDKNVVHEYIRNYINRNSRSQKTTFQNYEENLGSESKPYIIETAYPDSRTLPSTSSAQPSIRKYYCDNKRKVLKIEGFSSSTSIYPYATTLNTYSNDGNLLKMELKYQNEINGTFTNDSYTYEYEYLDGNNIKTYFSSRFSNIVQNKNLSSERVFTQYLRKENGGLGNIYNFDDERSKNYPLKETFYDSNGNKTSFSYTYELNEKGYVLQKNEFDSSGNKLKYTKYSYQCQ
jgi:hypothetical protein